MAQKRRPVTLPKNNIQGPKSKPNGGKQNPSRNVDQSSRFSLERQGLLAGGWLGWLGPVIATVLAALLRLPNLGRPHALVFDETYYAKDSLSTLYYGTERATIPSPEPIILNNTGKGHLNIFTDQPAFVVHPPVGKRLIAFGENLFGMTPFGWRIMVCLFGIATVLVTARVSRRLLNSNVAGTLAGLFLALDGVHIAMSRTALLDTFLAFFVISGFGMLLIDRDIRNNPDYPPKYGMWSRIAFTLIMGLACATKWSGLYYTLAFIALMFWWDICRRPEYGLGQRFAAAFKEDLISFITIPLGVIAVYITSWFGWFASSSGWDRNWAATQPPSSYGFIPEPLRNLWHYHWEMWNFHTHLTVAHNYRANPWGWPLLWRPTSFYYASDPTCAGAPKVTCSQEVIALGNPVIWWAGFVAIFVLLAIAIMRKHRAALPILVGFAAGWLPWLPFAYRTTFQFYSVVYLPFTIMALVMCIQLLDQRVGYIRVQKNFKPQFFRDATQDGWGPVSIGTLLVVAILAYYFWPLYVAQSIPYDDWLSHMWFRRWI